MFGYSRQGFYKHEVLLEKRSVQAREVIDIVNGIRAIMPRTGCRKMHGEVNRQLILRKIEPIGRDRFFEILRERDLLIKRKRRTVFTTDSYHRFRTYKNRLKNAIITKPNQAWVADITYLRIKNDFCYLFLLTDDYSRKIVGYNVSKDLSVMGAQKALKMASKQANGAEAIIHHSDRGIQYCCDAYVKQMKKHKMQISMTEVNHCYENAKAERVNGILKQEFYLNEVLPNYKSACKMVTEVIKIYNNNRWHQALNYMTPEAKHAA